MFDKFGEFDSVQELNVCAEGLKNEGDIESLMILAEENGIDKEDAQDYAEGYVNKLATPAMAALGKIDVERADMNPKGIMMDWIEYIKEQCLESDMMVYAVRRKGKNIKGCIGELLKWSFANQMPIDKNILKEAGVTAGKVTLGIPDMGTAKKIIIEYYMRK